MNENEEEQIQNHENNKTIDEEKERNEFDEQEDKAEAMGCFINGILTILAIIGIVAGACSGLFM